MPSIIRPHTIQARILTRVSQQAQWRTGALAIAIYGERDMIRADRLNRYLKHLCAIGAVEHVSYGQWRATEKGKIAAAILAGFRYRRSRLENCLK